MCLFLFVVCILLNIPLFLTYTPANKQLPTGSKSFFTIFYNSFTQFSSSLAGKITAYLLYALRNIIIYFIEIAVNVVLISSLKNFLKRKLTLTGTLNKSSLNGASNEQNKPKNDNKHADHKATVMVLIICILSTLEHSFYIAYTLYNMFRFDLISNTLFVVSNFLITFKHFFNIFLFFIFNKVFRKNFRKLFFKN